MRSLSKGGIALVEHGEIKSIECIVVVKVLQLDGHISDGACGLEHFVAFEDHCVGLVFEFPFIGKGASKWSV